MLTIGLIRERKAQPDNRVALTPAQCRQVMEVHDKVRIKVEPSEKRCFPDNAYQQEGITLSSDLSDADWLIGVKEVPPEGLIPNKTYTFFSHTIKQQAHNRKLLQAILSQNVRLIDLELLNDEAGNRLIGFGNYAGIVGAHYAIMMYGFRTGAYHVSPAHQLPDYQTLIKHVKGYKIPPCKILIAGSGRVGQGSRTYLKAIGIREVSPSEYLKHDFQEPVFTLLSPSELYQQKDGLPFEKPYFKAHPEAHESKLDIYFPTTDVMINAVYWEHGIPRHFSIADTQRPDFRISTIADVSCDIQGAVPINFQYTTPDKPVYGYNPLTNTITEPYQEGTIDVMAISNLPNELPCDASTDFGAVMRDQIIPAFLQNEWQRLFRDATIAYNGELMPGYEYLKDFVAQKPEVDKE